MYNCMYNYNTMYVYIILYARWGNRVYGDSKTKQYNAIAKTTPAVP